MKTYLYAPPSPQALDWGGLVNSLQELLPGFVEAQGEFVASLLEASGVPLSTLALEMAQARVRNPLHREEASPLPGEVAYEERRLSSPSQAWGIAYDGLRYMAALRPLIPPSERTRKHIHIVFTNQLLATWGEGERYHLRVGVYGFPSLLSLPGVVEAPARPREYYLLKQQYAALGMGDAGAFLEPQFAGRILRHNDPRLTKALEGYVLQALFYHLYGEPFCSEPTCPLYNSHWQEEVLRAQVEGKLCPNHQQKLCQIARQ